MLSQMNYQNVVCAFGSHTNKSATVVTLRAQPQSKVIILWLDPPISAYTGNVNPPGMPGERGSNSQGPLPLCAL